MALSQSLPIMAYNRDRLGGSRECLFVGEVIQPLFKRPLLDSDICGSQ